MHETELAVTIVEVEMQALARFSHDFEPGGLAVAAHGKRAARLDHGEDADHPFRDVIAFGNGAGLGFFEFVHNVRRRGKALLSSLLTLLIAP